MKAKVLPLLLGVVLLTATSGCLVAPVTELNDALTRNRVLSEQSRAQLVEIENIKAHNRDVEDRLVRSEQQLATLEQKASLDRQQIARYERERDVLYAQSNAIAEDRQENHRVEISATAPDAQMVGSANTTPNVY